MHLNKINLFSIFKKNIGNKTKKYKHFLSLGYNCENAYRFFKKYHFVESSLFTWTNSHDIGTLLNALKDLNLIFRQQPIKVEAMWECPDTKILFHGTEPKEMNINYKSYTNEQLKPYKEELISRVEHLKKKFINQLIDNEKTLIAYTYKTTCETQTEIIKNILELKKALEELGANNFELLIILEKHNKINFEQKNIFIRYVDSFAPHNNVLTKKYDKKSWNKILNEFKADFKLKKTKKFKFENIT